MLTRDIGNDDTLDFLTQISISLEFFLSKWLYLMILTILMQQTNN